MQYRDVFKGKKITLMGLGLLGRGVGDAEFLLQQGAEVLVTDLKSTEALQTSINKIKDYPNVSFRLGEHRLEDFEDRDFILKAAGVPLDSPFIEYARKAGIPIEMSTSLFVSLLPAGVKTVGITGTRGKTTVTRMIAEALEKTGHRVHLGGNTQGVSTLAMLPEIKEGDIVVMELDSWQLQGFGERQVSPQVAVFTTFLPDHMNYYKDDMDAYLADKANIFLAQDVKGTVILGSQCQDIILNKYKEQIKSHIVVPEQLPDNFKINLVGEHNRYNAALAREALRALGIADSDIEKTLGDFKGVEGRLELRREINGVRIYNDTTATTPVATIAGLRALQKLGSVVLIMGGADKVLDMSELVKILPEYTKKVILLPGTGTDKLQKEFNFSELGIKSFQAFDLKDAVNGAMAVASKGDAVLFSPAFASFGMFKNEYDRGEKFNKVVSEIKD